MKSKKKITLVISISAMMIALQFVFERYLSIPIGGSFRITSTFIPRAITGMCLNVLLCGFCSLSADVIGSVLFYGQVNPFISLSALLRGIAFGFLFRNNKKPGPVKTVLIVLFDQLICGGIVTTIGLILFNGSPNTFSFWKLRFLQSIGLVLVELPVLFIMEKFLFPPIRSFLSVNGFFDSNKKEEKSSDN